MRVLFSVSDSDLSRMRGLVLAERAAAADVIEHLLEIDRRKLYLDQACSSLYRYCMERLGYSEDEALRRVRVARLSRKLPRVLEELRSGAMHLTGLFLLSGHLTEHNAAALLAEARGQSRREIEKVLARWFPQPDTGTRIQPILALSPLGPGFEFPGTPPTASSSTIGPSYPGTGRATAWNSSATCLPTGRSPVETRPEQGNSLMTMKSSPLGRGDVKGTPLRARTWPGIGRSVNRRAPGVLVTHGLGPQSSQRGRGAVRRISLEERRRHPRA